MSKQFWTNTTEKGGVDVLVANIILLLIAVTVVGIYFKLPGRPRFSDDKQVVDGHSKDSDL